MLFDIPYVAGWNKIGDFRQHQTDQNNARKNKARVDYNYKVGKVLIQKDGVLRKSESCYDSEPWTITTVQTTRVECRSKLERINIQRVAPFFEEYKNRNKVGPN